MAKEFVGSQMDEPRKDYHEPLPKGVPGVSAVVTMDRRKNGIHVRTESTILINVENE